MVDQKRMEELTRGLGTKSEKIRTLGSAGYSRQQIADFLRIRYQHVRNVLLDQERKRQGFSEAASGPARDASVHPAAPAGPGKVLLSPDGSIFLPPGILDAAGYRPGDTLFVRALADGEVRLLSSRAAIRRAQDLVREFVPADVSLVDDLLRDRRREAEHEHG